MPLAQPEHHHDRIQPWLWGLLPDNDRVRNRWVRTFHRRATVGTALRSRRHDTHPQAGGLRPRRARPQRASVLAGSACGRPARCSVESGGCRRQGPSAAAIASLLTRCIGGNAGRQARERFADALALNWLLAGSDAHAKNTRCCSVATRSGSPLCTTLRALCRTPPSTQARSRWPRGSAASTSARACPLTAGAGPLPNSTWTKMPCCAVSASWPGGCRWHWRRRLPSLLWPCWTARCPKGCRPWSRRVA